MFDAPYRVVAAGEASGRLGTVLQRLADEREAAEAALRQRILSALLYPAIVTAFALAIVVFLMTYVVPQVAQAFASGKRAADAHGAGAAGERLAARLGFDAAAAAGRRGGLAAGPPAPAAWLALDRAWLRLPLLGRLARQLDVARRWPRRWRCWQAGVPLLRALATVADNAAQHRAAARRTRPWRWCEGAPLAAALATRPALAGLLVTFARLGEETGQLGPMLRAPPSSWPTTPSAAAAADHVARAAADHRHGRRGAADRAGGDAADHPAQLVLTMAALPDPDDGWLPGARRVLSNHGPGARPACSRGSSYCTDISLPPGEYGGPWIERLFTNTLDWDAHPYFQGIRGLEVSAHVHPPRRRVRAVRRAGPPRLGTPAARRGRGTRIATTFRSASSWRGWRVTFTDAQYAALAALLAALRERAAGAARGGRARAHRLGRKHDPGAGFDWARLIRLTAGGVVRQRRAPGRPSTPERPGDMDRAGDKFLGPPLAPGVCVGTLRIVFSADVKHYI